jgi:hypothetical protein
MRLPAAALPMRQRHPAPWLRLRLAQAPILDGRTP